MATMTAAKCHCCDVPLYVQEEVLGKLKLPATFCRRCFNLFDFLTLRKWFVLDLLCRQVQAISGR